MPIPWGLIASAGFGGLQSLMGSGDQDEGSPNLLVQGFPGPVDDPGGPPTRAGREGSALGDAVTAQENWLSSLVGHAMAPVSLPGAVAQPVQRYAGGALPMQFGVTGVDPAWAQPGQTVLGGLNVEGMDYTPQQDPTFFNNELLRFWSALQMAGAGGSAGGGAAGGAGAPGGSGVTPDDPTRTKSGPCHPSTVDTVNTCAHQIQNVPAHKHWKEKSPRQFSINVRTGACVEECIENEAPPPPPPPPPCTGSQRAQKEKECQALGVERFQTTAAFKVNDDCECEDTGIRQKQGCHEGTVQDVNTCANHNWGEYAPRRFFRNANGDCVEDCDRTRPHGPGRTDDPDNGGPDGPGTEQGENTGGGGPTRFDMQRRVCEQDPRKVWHDQGGGRGVCVDAGTQTTSPYAPCTSPPAHHNRCVSKNQLSAKGGPQYQNRNGTCVEVGCRKVNRRKHGRGGTTDHNPDNLWSGADGGWG